MLVTAVSFHWLTKTVDYLSEWRIRDQFGSLQPEIRRRHCITSSDGIPRESGKLWNAPKNAPLPPEEAKHYVSVVWKDDPRLPKLAG